MSAHAPGPIRAHAAASIEPISVRVPTAIAMTGLSRSRIYELIASGELRIAKDRRCTLILVDSLREVVASRIVVSEMDAIDPPVDRPATAGNGPKAIPARFRPDR